MRVLFVVGRPPFPPLRGDQLRSYHLLQHLAVGHSITLVVATDAGGSAPGGFGTLTVPTQHLGVGRAERLSRMALGTVDRRPMQVLPLAGKRARERVAELAREHDLTHGHLLRVAPLLADSTPVVIDLVDSLSLNLRRRAEHDRGPAAWAAHIESKRLARYEQQVMAASAATIVSSADDAEHLGGAPLVIPNGVDVDRFPFDARARLEPVIVFGGNLGYFPNVDAARTLAEQVMPEVLRAVPEARLVLAGARPAAAVRRLAGPRVTVVSTPDDLAAVVAAAAVTVIPVRAGSGMQNKVLEAMAVGTPVVTTTRAAAAIGATPGVQLLTADDSATAAAAAVRILGDPALAARLREAAHRHVLERFTWARAAAAVAGVWERAARS